MLNKPVRFGLILSVVFSSSCDVCVSVSPVGNQESAPLQVLPTFSLLFGFNWFLLLCFIVRFVCHHLGRLLFVFPPHRLLVLFKILTRQKLSKELLVEFFKFYFIFFLLNHKDNRSCFTFSPKKQNRQRGGVQQLQGGFHLIKHRVPPT